VVFAMHAPVNKMGKYQQNKQFIKNNSFKSKKLSFELLK